jgi:hypothetical protein
MLAEPTIDGQISTAVSQRLARTKFNRNAKDNKVSGAELSVTAALYDNHNPTMSGEI